MWCFTDEIVNKIVQGIVCVFMLGFSIFGCVVLVQDKTSCDDSNSNDGTFLWEYGVLSFATNGTIFIGLLTLILYNYFGSKEFIVRKFFENKPFSSIFILICNFAYVMWGAVELLRDDCYKNTEIYNACEGAVIVQVISLCFGVLLLGQGIRDEYDEWIINRRVKKNISDKNERANKNRQTIQKYKSPLVESTV